MEAQAHNPFNMSYYGDIIDLALSRGYKFVTLREFVALGCPRMGYFIIRHDVDKSPLSLNPITKVESARNIRSTVFIRVAGADYNPFGYGALDAFRRASAAGMEIGLHTAFVEFALINKLDPVDVLKGELAVLRTFFPVHGVAPHRDINYMFNSLPMLEHRWQELSGPLGLEYQAYDSAITQATTYVNEGFDPHLCWRTLTPHDAIDRSGGGSIYMLTHPHWWYEVHPFEAT